MWCNASPRTVAEIVCHVTTMLPVNQQSMMIMWAVRILQEHSLALFASQLREEMSWAGPSRSVEGDEWAWGNCLLQDHFLISQVIGAVTTSRECRVGPASSLGNIQTVFVRIFTEPIRQGRSCTKVNAYCTWCGKSAQKQTPLSWSRMEEIIYDGWCWHGSFHPQ